MGENFLQRLLNEELSLLFLVDRLYFILFLYSFSLPLPHLPVALCLYQPLILSFSFLLCHLSPLPLSPPPSPSVFPSYSYAKEGQWDPMLCNDVCVLICWSSSILCFVLTGRRCHAHVRQNNQQTQRCVHRFTIGRMHFVNMPLTYKQRGETAG